MVQNLRNSIWNSNLTYHQFKNIQANFYYECAIYFTIAIISTHTQEQKDSNQNEILVVLKNKEIPIGIVILKIENSQVTNLHFYGKQ